MRHLVAKMGSELTEQFDVISPVERAMALRGVPIFGSLSPEDLHRIAASADERNHAAGSGIFKLSDPGTEMVVVIEGNFAAVSDTDEGRQTFAEYGPGDS
jgi:CRP-like cAMP-binding protein